MHKEEFSYSINSTEENQTPEPMISELKPPKFVSHSYKLDLRSDVLSPLDTSSFSIHSPFTTVVPQLDYLKYRDQHFSKRHTRSPRFHSESPSFNYFYQPQVLQVSPRSKVKVFSYFPIVKEIVHLKSKQKKSKVKNTQMFSNQPRILPAINQKLTRPDQEMKPALTYGEKLWKLYELASLDKT